MRLGIDARPLQHETQFRGIGKSLEFFLIALKGELEPGDELVFYLDEGLPRPELLKIFPDSTSKAIPTARLGQRRYFRSFLSSFRPINPPKGEIDVLLQYDATFGIPRKVPSVVVFHDLIPYLFRGQEKQRSRKGLKKTKDDLAREMYWRKYLRTLDTYQYASRLIAISESSKKDLLKHIKGVKSSDITVIPHGVSLPAVKGRPSSAVKKLAEEPYLFYVGGIDLRKNIVGLLKTFYELKNKYPDLRLVMAGKEFGLSDQLDSLGWFEVFNSRPAYAKDVIFPGFISSADLNYFYEHARAFVLTSRYEGFGMPVLEAMSAGCPVVAYDNSSIPEVAGDAVLLIKDGESLAPAVEKLLKNPKLRAELARKGKKQAAKFRWDVTVTETLKLLRSLKAK